MNEWTRKWLHRDSIRIRIIAANSIRDSIWTKISDSQVPNFSFSVVCVCVCVCWNMTGPSVLDVFNTLLRHLHTSVDCQSSVRRQSVIKPCVDEDSNVILTDTSSDAISVEQQFQNAVVGAIGMIL